MLKHIIGVLLSVFAVHCADAAGTSRQVFGGGVFTIELPSDWIENKTSKFFSFSSPDGRVSLTTSAYSKDNGSFDEFSNYRFSSIDEWYKPVGKKSTVSSAKVETVFREFEGVWPGESKPTYYVVSCLKLGKVFASITFTTDRQEFERNREKYVQILRSVKPGS